MSDEFDTEMSDPEKFNDCTCDKAGPWAGIPHRHIGALREDDSEAETS